MQGYVYASRHFLGGFQFFLLWNHSLSLSLCIWKENVSFFLHIFRIEMLFSLMITCDEGAEEKKEHSGEFEKCQVSNLYYVP